MLSTKQLHYFFRQDKVPYFYVTSNLTNKILFAYSGWSSFILNDQMNQIKFSVWDLSDGTHIIAQIW